MTKMTQARRRGQILLLLDNALVSFGFYLAFPLISSHFVGQLHWPALWVGCALGGRQLCQQGLGWLGGALADRLGAKPPILAGLLLRALSFALLARADDIALLLASCLLAGVGGALFEPARGALLARLLPASRRERFYAWLMSGENLSAVSGAWCGSLLLDAGFAWVGAGGALAFLLAALANAWLLPAYRATRPALRRRSSAAIVWRDRPFLALAFSYSGYYILLVQMMMLLPLTLQSQAGTQRAAGWLYAQQTALTLLFAYPLTRGAERLWSRERRVGFGLAMMTLALALISAQAAAAATLLCAGVFMLGMLLVEPAREGQLMSLAKPQARAGYLGAGRLGQALGGAAGYLIGGGLADLSRSLAAPALPWLVLAAIGVLTCLGLRQAFANIAPAGVAAPRA